MILYRKYKYQRFVSIGMIVNTLKKYKTLIDIYDVLH